MLDLHVTTPRAGYVCYRVEKFTSKRDRPFSFSKLLYHASTDGNAAQLPPDVKLGQLITVQSPKVLAQVQTPPTGSRAGYSSCCSIIYGSCCDGHTGATNTCTTTVTNAKDSRWRFQLCRGRSYQTRINLVEVCGIEGKNYRVHQSMADLVQKNWRPTIFVRRIRVFGKNMLWSQTYVDVVCPCWLR